ncbi:protein croquemort [Daphnia magna]|uniref:Uncharacterized protein n=1 Tax=Daphnia magna TaxID=35525 RepID=A0ABQ9ZTZ2_9CRUS|nr:protein croquemort [Daphnia magna]KAK4016392.1 hypothetical protein OUZ56_031343 [Daphnia magna]
MSRGPVFWGIFGMVGAIIGVVFAVGIPFLVSFIVDQQLRLQPGTIMYKFWETSPVPMYIRFYMYNVTNSDDVLNLQVKPIVEEIGPFTYTEVHERVNVERYDNFTLKFQQKRYWQYVEEMSNGSLEDPITTLNVPLLSAAYTIRFKPQFIKAGFNAFIRKTNTEIFVTKTVNELLFAGYSDPLLNFSQLIPPGYLDIPPGYDKFGWFYKRNGSETYDGVFNIFTGVDDISKLDVMDMWNYTRKTEYYESYCGMVNGSFGEGWPPRRERTSIEMYSTDLCRSITLDYTQDVSKKGVTFYRFAGTERMFASAQENPDNWCFWSGDVFNLSGVSNSSTCRYGAPAFVSFPHYYLADSFLQNQVEGLNPQKELHEFHVDLEPRTAVPLQVAARFQINILLESIKGISILKNVRQVYMPVMWFGVSADLTDSLLGWIHFTLIGPYIGSFCFFLLFVASMVVVAKSGIKYAKMKRIQPKNEVTITEDSDK